MSIFPGPIHFLGWLSFKQDLSLILNVYCYT